MQIELASVKRGPPLSTKRKKQKRKRRKRKEEKNRKKEVHGHFYLLQIQKDICVAMLEPRAPLFGKSSHSPSVHQYLWITLLFSARC